MKIRDWGVSVALVVSAALFWGCKGKPADEAAVEGEQEEVVEIVEGDGGSVIVKDGGKVVVPAKALPKWTRESAGFARYLPQDTDLYLEVRKLDELWELMEEFETENVLDRLDLGDVADAVGEDVEDVEKMEGDARTVLRGLFGEEVFMSVRGLEWLLEGYVFYMEDIYPDLVGTMVEAGLERVMMEGDAEPDTEEMVERMMEDMQAFLEKQLESVDGDPVLSFQVGGKVSEGREEVVEKIRGWLALVEGEQEELEKISFDRNGVEWVGFQYDWYSELMEEAENTENDDPDFDEAKKQQLLEILKVFENSPMLVVCGEVGDYVVVTAGLGEVSVEMKEEVAGSLVAEKGFDHLEGYAAENIVGASWMSEGIVGTFKRLGSYGPVWEGLALGAERTEGLKYGADMASSLGNIAQLTREKEAGKAFDHIGALVLRDGLHWETRGGWLSDWVDLESPLKLAAALDEWESPPFFRAHWRERKEKDAKTLGQLEEAATVVKTIMAEIGEYTAEFEDLEEGLDEDEREDLRRERELGASLRKDFLKSTENLWVGYRDYFRESLGEEVALVMDLEGESPPLFGLDEEVLENGRIPRVAYVRPVVDREGLGKTWGLWRQSATLLFGIVSEWSDTPIPFPDTMSADSNELRTHFFSMPFATDDFLPSLSVSDELFVVGTSKALASKVDKAVRAVGANGGERSGVLVELEMGQFWDFCEAWGGIMVANWTGVKKMTEKDFELLESPAEPPLTPEEEAKKEEAEEDVATLEDLLGDDEKRFEVPEEGDDDAAEGEKGAEEKAAEFDLGDLPFVDFEGLNEPEEYLQLAIEKARWWKGVSYRRWLDDGEPRSSASIHWGDPAESE